MPAYEVSNHAAPGKESRHNLIYWRQGDWAAVGPGAHGRLSLPSGRVATVAERTPGRWLALVGENGNGDIEHEQQTGEDLASEYLLMSMRLAEGLDLQRYRAKGGLLDTQRVVRLVEDGLLELSDERACATSAGRPLLNYVLREMAG